VSLKIKSARASFLLTACDAVGFACSLVRNMILARVLTKADFGIAATFAIVISLFEFSGKMGIGQCIIRDKEGDNQDFVSAAHLMQFSAGAVSGLTIVAGAWPLAHLFGISELAWAVASLSLVAILRGCEHMDIRRFERELRVGPASFVELIPQVTSALAAWPVANWLHDYRAVLVLLLGKSAIGCVCTHLVAERSYRWKLHADYLTRMFQFGWPLVINGFLMFGVVQGEQFVIATFYLMSDVAPYAAAASLALMPVFFFGRVFGSVLLPLLAKVQDDPELFRRRYRQVLSALACLAGSCSVGFIIGGEAIMSVVYGEKYKGTGLLLAILATAGALRTIRASTALAALAKGDSRNELYSNGLRLIGIVPAIVFAFLDEPIWKVALSGVLGESAACCVSIVRLRRRDGLPLAATLIPIAWLVLLITLASLGVYSGAHRISLVLSMPAAVLAALLSGLWLTVALPELRHEALALQRTARTVGWAGVLPLLRGSPLSG
jgi:O-antigen/teichoic acid export membrane protein